jgi:hypothetical protein
MRAESWILDFLLYRLLQILCVVLALNPKRMLVDQNGIIHLPYTQLTKLDYDWKPRVAIGELGMRAESTLESRISTCL